MDFIEQLELEVGSQKLNDPTSPEYLAKEWIIHKDEAQLLPTDLNFIQRFLMAAFYFDTHQVADWRSCNQQSFDPVLNETEMCDFLKVSNIDPLEFDACEYKVATVYRKKMDTSCSCSCLCCSCNCNYGIVVLVYL